MLNFLLKIVKWIKKRRIYCNLSAFADLAVGDCSRKRKNERSISSLHTFSDSGASERTSTSSSVRSSLITPAPILENNQTLIHSQIVINGFRDTLARTRMNTTNFSSAMNMVHFFNLPMFWLFFSKNSHHFWLESLLLFFFRLNRFF